MSQLRDRLRTADARWLLAIFIVAFGVRLALVAYAHPNPRDGRYDDSVWYDTTATRLAEGKGYVFDPTVWKAPNGDLIYPGETDLTPTALWPPGYPLTLAGVYKITGDSLWAARLLNVLFGSLTAALVFLIAKQLFGRRPGIFAGFSLALFPSHILFTAVLLSETYFGFLLALQLALYAYFVFDRPKPNLPLLLALGALTAFTGYVRGEFMAYGGIFALLVLFHFRRRALLPLLALAAGAAIVVTPWTVRNHIHFDQWIVGTTGAGRVVFQGHNEKTDGGPSLEAFWRLEQDYKGLSRKEIELKANKDGSKLAREWAQDHKLEELRLVPRRMYMLFRSDESGVTWVQSNKAWFGTEGADRLIRLSSAMFYGLIALSLAGWPLWWKTFDTRRWAVFGIVPFYMIVFGVLFIGDPRYHYALYIPLAIFSSTSLSAIWGATVARWRDVFGDRSLGSLLRTFGTPSR
jgi:4-amino-4-deoxy-L-arabinose transferase-like glycosyltransferase